MGLFNAAMSQKIVDIRGEYTYILPKNITLEQAEQEAINQAILDALIGEFGQVIEQRTTTRIENVNGKSRIEFYSEGGSVVNADYNNIEPPKIKYIVEDNILKIRAEVYVRAREIISANYDIDAKVLRNLPMREKDVLKYVYNENETFNSGDEICLYFMTPIDGWLAVYFHDNETHEVSPLLNLVEIKHDKPDVFLRPQSDLDSPVNLTSDGNSSLCKIIFIFSPEKYISIKKEKMSYEDFERWLGQCRKRDKQMTRKDIQIIVK
ncbi:MAG: hypothetical protein IJK62_10100 [Bacteroidales bacterium]|nr:hypothetical protein [Bacteroidales bacterium]